MVPAFLATHYGMDFFILIGLPVVGPIIIGAFIAAVLRKTTWVYALGSVIGLTIVFATTGFDSGYSDEPLWSLGGLVVSSLCLLVADWITATEPGVLLSALFPARYLRRRENVVVFLLLLQALTVAGVCLTLILKFRR